MGLIKQPAREVRTDEGTASSLRGPVLRVDLHTLFLVFPIKYMNDVMVNGLCQQPFRRAALPRERENGLRMGLPGFKFDSAMRQGPRARYWMLSGPQFPY